ncbi:uncharacterized protein LOC135372086 [Ornithodoros turicata]|uniref:uncharacterized protein LOC135372086 n=1 Tax=Ornithodoros turicata TaxID=34597 RepID=UPI0031386F33
MSGKAKFRGIYLILDWAGSRSSAAAKPRAGARVVLETLVWYDEEFKTKVEQTGDLGSFVKYIINSMNARLLMEFKNITIQLILVKIEAVPDGASFWTSENGEPRLWPQTSSTSMYHYIRDEATDEVKNTDVVFFLSG